MKRLTAVLLCVSLLFTCTGAQALTRDELRTAWRSVMRSANRVELFEQEPDIVSFRQSGSLTRANTERALGYVNFVRMIAGLESVSVDPLYTLRAQNAALLLAANDVLTHSPEKAPGMSDDLYASAYTGAQQSNIIRLNWNSADILIDGIAYFARDDGGNNLEELSHRRWVLDPAMAATGFGLAFAQSGASFVAMYATDCSREDAQWDTVCWPAKGAFPADLMSTDLPWSVSLNDEIYDIALSSPSVTLTELNSGLCFEFSEASSDGWFRISTERHGSGSCLIFRPDAGKFTLNGYEQNQRWQVEVSGLVLRGGSAATLSYETDMISLLVQDPVSVEIDPQNAELSVGETAVLTASVIPVYADDVSVSWESSDPAVASVSQDGTVTALVPGKCTVTAESVNGRSDVCAVTVH